VLEFRDLLAGLCALRGGGVFTKDGERGQNLHWRSWADGGAATNCLESIAMLSLADRLRGLRVELARARWSWGCAFARPSRDTGHR